MDIEKKLKESGFILPEPPPPGGSYVPVNVRANIAYVAIQFPVRNGERLFTGRLGNEITTEQGVKAMELCALNILSQINKSVGFENILGLNHLDAFYQAVDNWDEAPVIVNGASDLFLKVLGEKGQHSRSVFGVHKLSRNFCSGLCSSFTLLK